MKNVKQSEITNGVFLTEKEIKEVEAVFNSIDNLHKKEEKKAKK